MFSLLFKKNYSISILHGSESLPVVVITIHPPKGRQATPKGQPKGGEVYFPFIATTGSVSLETVKQYIESQRSEEHQAKKNQQFQKKTLLE